MGSINIYKINNKTIKQLRSKLSEDYVEAEKKIITKARNNQHYEFSLYTSKNAPARDVSWKWVADEFGEAIPKIKDMPKAVLLVKVHNGEDYAVTFGYSYALVNRYAEKDFGLNFARKTSFEEIKTTAIVSPGMKRNKAINSFINNDELDSESGEAFAKIKMRLDDEQLNELIKSTIEIGSSISLTINSDSCESIMKVVEYIIKVMKKEDVNDIPMFREVKDKSKIAYLDGLLVDNIVNGDVSINISEIDIIGTREVFNSNSAEYKLTHNRRKKKGSNLTIDTLLEFIEENQFDINKDILNIKVHIVNMDGSERILIVKEIIDYVVESEKCVLYQGKWYEYNDDYINNLDKSLSKIEVEYNPAYDFSESKHNDYIQAKLLSDEKSFSVVDMDAKKKKYYAELVFNELMMDAGYENYDRGVRKVDGYKMEPMDLYKDGCMYAVKMGSTSSKLCYTVDQSLTSLRLYDNGKLTLPGDNKIDKVGLWFVLDRNQHIEGPDGKPDLKKLKMLMLKNSIDAWAKTVRRMNYKPIIYINYRY